MHANHRDQPMKKHTTACLLFICLMSASAVQAATCRSAEAASRGAEVGYERDQQAAQETEEQTLTISDMLGKCVGGITGIGGMTTFPSFGDIWAQIKNRICAVVRNQITGVVNQANSEINGVVYEVNSEIREQIRNTGVNNTGAGTIVGSSDVPRVDAPNVGRTYGTSSLGTDSETSQSSEFWNNIWR